ncbi:MAG: LuxR C-terminal-related transcriptional regulator [Clostridia bacterium]|nr:LuxR C-terminal-related transcriptional regulator [Clostridia bacterium]
MDQLQKELQSLLHSKSLQELFEYMDENITDFLSTPYISQYYQILKDTDISTSKKTMPKIIKAWLAFLSGDNAGLSWIMKHIKETDLGNQYESSFYYSLKALAGFLSDHNDRMKYAKLSLDVLPEEDRSFYMANAKLTYGQLLASVDQFRLASEMFASSYQMFYSLDLQFPAVVALVNELLNRYKLGEFSAVIDACNKALVMSSSFKNEMQDYWNVVHMPLGMCYYEMNKPNLAIRHLKLAKSSIDRMGMFHMHGHIELYLFKSYYLLKDTAGMEEVRNESIANFEHMHYKMTDLLISMFRILSCEPGHDSKLQPDIENFEVEYMKNGDKSHDIVIETLAYLKLKGLSDVITDWVLVKNLERLRFIGMIPQVQLFLVLLAEMYCNDGRLEEANEYLKEAVDIYKEFGISAGFYRVPLKSLSRIQKMDQSLYNMLNRKNEENTVLPKGSLLSAREKDIMMLIAMGRSNDEISKTLFIGIGTIKWHINHIFGKLGVKNRIQAIEKAKSLGEIL